MELGALYYDLSLNDEHFKAGIVGARAEAQGFGQSLQGLASSTTKAGAAFLPMSIAAGAAIGLSAKAAIDFEQSMELLHTQAGATQQEVDSLKDKVLALAPAVGIGPDILAKGLFYVESAGFHGAAAMDVLKLAAEGAQVGQASFTDTANALTSVMNTQIIGAQNATETMGNLNAIVGAGKMHFQDLNDAISTGVLATAKVFGVSLDSVGAALATLTRNGVPASDAATKLRLAMTLMGAPTSTALKALTAVGFTMTDAKASTQAMTDALAKAHIGTTTLAKDMQQPNGINVAMQDLRDHLKAAGVTSKESAAIIAKAFGGTRGSSAILPLLEDSKGLNSTFKQIQGSAGNFGKDWAAQQKTAKAKMDEFTASLGILEVHLGNKFLPALTNAAKSLTGMADAFGKLPSGVQNAIGGVLVFAAVMAPILLAVGAVMRAFAVLVPVVEGFATVLAPLAGMIAGALGIPFIGVIAIIAGVIALVVALGIGIYEAVTHWGQITKFFEGLWHTSSGFVGNMFNDVIGFFKRIPGAVGAALAALPGLALAILEDVAFGWGLELGIIWKLVTKWIPDTVVAIVVELGKLPGQVGHLFQQVWSAITSWLVRAWSDASNFAAHLYNSVVSWFSALPGRVGRAGSDMFSAFKSAIWNLPGEMWSVLQTIASHIKYWAGHLASAIGGVANDMWAAFKKGIGKASPSHFERAFTDIAQSSVDTVDTMKRSVTTLAGLTRQTSMITPVAINSPSAALSAARAGVSVVAGDNASGGPSVPPNGTTGATTHNHYYDLKGIMASGKSDLKTVAHQLIDAYNEDMRAQRMPQIGKAQPA